MSQYPPETMRALDAQADSLDEAEREYALALPRFLENISVDEVLDELSEVDGELQAAINKNDAACIGRIVLNVRVALAARQASGGKRGIRAHQAAALAIYGETL